MRTHRILVVTAKGVFVEPERTLHRIRRQLVLRGAGEVPHGFSQAGRSTFSRVADDPLPPQAPRRLDQRDRAPGWDRSPWPLLFEMARLRRDARVPRLNEPAGHRSTSMITTERGSTQPAAGGEVGEGLVDGLAGGADQLGELLLGEVVVDVDAVVGGAAEPVGEVEQCLCDPAGTSENTRSATTSLALRSRLASWVRSPRATTGRPSSHRSRSSWRARRTWCR